MKTEELIAYPWPFPQWNGERFVMPLELAPKEVQKELKKASRTEDLADVEEAPF